MNSKYIVMSLLAAGLLGGCKSAPRQVAIADGPEVVIPDSAGMARLDVTFRVPTHYVAARSRLFITPALVRSDTLVDEYNPMVIDGAIYKKKILRKEVLEGYADPYAGKALAAGDTLYSYSELIAVPDSLDGAGLVAVVSSDGCGDCSGIDTLNIARISIPANLIDAAASVKETWVEPEFVVKPKIHSGKGEARLQFVVNKWDIEMDLADNRRELTGMLDSLRPILLDSLSTLTSLNIFGSASAEASYAYNVRLADNRANAAKSWLSAQLELPADVRRIIKVGALPEGWEPVVQAMIAANDPDSTLVRDIMRKYPGPTDDAAEKYIRRLPCWNRIKQNYLAKDRKVIYDYSWTIRSFTDDEELIRMYRTRPDAFNEEELLRVASLAKDDASRRQVYETILEYFPSSAVAANNLALLMIRDGETGAAREVLARQEEKTPEMLNTLGESYLRDGDYAKAAEALRDVDLSAARYNLGLALAKQRKYGEAYGLLRPFADENAAICAKALGLDSEQRQMIEKGGEQ